MNLIRITYTEQPSLANHVFAAVKKQAWPEFMFHDPVANALWGYLEEDFAAYQFALIDKDADDAIAAVGHTLPFRWDAPLDALPEGGWDAIFQKAVDDLKVGREPNTATAIEASIAPAYQGKGVSKLILQAMRDLAQAQGFKSLVAPVRPSHKSRYPLTPIDRYVAWTTNEGAPFDPWLRTHWRLGARIIKVAPQSMRIPGTVAMWAQWTGMAFPESGSYVVPSALNPIEISREKDEGVYVEPNVWMEHTLRPRS